MTEEKKKETPKFGPFAFHRQLIAKNNTGTLKPKQPVFAQKTFKKVTGRGR